MMSTQSPSQHTPKQNTLARPISRSGIGLHSAKLVDISLNPAPEDTGIVFRRVDISNVNTEIPAHSRHVADTMLNSRIMNDEGVAVGTVEHLMAAFYGMGIDNAFVDVTASELPAMDGSALPYCQMIAAAGVAPQKAPRQFLKVLEPVLAQTDTGWIEITPADETIIDISINFNNPVIGASKYFYINDDNNFEDELAPARTFCFYDDIAKLRAAGYALGGSLENAIVVKGDTILNDDGLRFSDEFVRHKTLDCLGDLYLCGAFVLGHITAHQPSHTLNNALIKALLAQPHAYEMTGSLGFQPPYTAPKQPLPLEGTLGVHP